MRLLLDAHAVVRRDPIFANTTIDDLKSSEAVRFRCLAEVFREASCFNVVSRMLVEARLAPRTLPLFDAIRSFIPKRRGLQNVLAQAQLPLVPTYGYLPPTREEFYRTLEYDPKLADKMVNDCQIPLHLPMIDAATETIPKDHFKNVRVVAVQHILASNVTMFSALASRGLDPHETQIIGVPYSTNYVSEHALRTMGFSVQTPDVIDPNQVTSMTEAAVLKALEDAVEKSRKDGKPILLLDDGGVAITTAQKYFPNDAHLFRAVEQTTRGITDVKAMPFGVQFPIVDVARAPMKDLESDPIGAQVVANIEMLLQRLSMMEVRGRSVCIAGFGRIGRSLAKAVQARGGRVHIYDTDPNRRRQAEALGYEACGQKEIAYAHRSLIIGATGHRSFTREDLDLVDHECVLASTSSKDVEIDVSVNKDDAVQSIPVLTEGPGDRRFVTRVWRMKNKDVVLLRNGFPINFDGAHETGLFREIEPTRAIMILGAAQAIMETKPELVALAHEPQKKLAMRFGLRVNGPGF